MCRAGYSCTDAGVRQGVKDTDNAPWEKKATGA